MRKLLLREKEENSINLKSLKQREKRIEELEKEKRFDIEVSQGSRVMTPLLQSFDKSEISNKWIIFSKGVWGDLCHTLLVAIDGNSIFNCRYFTFVKSLEQIVSKHKSSLRVVAKPLMFVASVSCQIFVTRSIFFIFYRYIPIRKTFGKEQKSCQYVTDSSYSCRWKL